jgi:hypothetical protein
MAIAVGGPHHFPVKALLSVTAAAETATGLALAGFPLLVITLLVGESLETPAALILARMTGAALISLGVACWLARSDTGSRAARGLVGALLFYNAAAVAVLMYAGAGLRLHGIGLWPTVVLHAAMAAWCIACLRNAPMLPATTTVNLKGQTR